VVGWIPPLSRCAWSDHLNRWHSPRDRQSSILSHSFSSGRSSPLVVVVVVVHGPAPSQYCTTSVLIATSPGQMSSPYSSLDAPPQTPTTKPILMPRKVCQKCDATVAACCPTSQAIHLRVVRPFRMMGFKISYLLQVFQAEGWYSLTDNCSMHDHRLPLQQDFHFLSRTIFCAVIEVPSPPRSINRLSLALRRSLG
jgi:hypothetical protein